MNDNLHDMFLFVFSLHLCCTVCSFLRPEPHILLFRRLLGTDPVSGKVDPELEHAAKEKYAEELSGNIRK